MAVEMIITTTNAITLLAYDMERPHPYRATSEPARKTPSKLAQRP
jgi:hypothetical protein